MQLPRTTLIILFLIFLVIGFSGIYAFAQIAASTTTRTITLTTTSTVTITISTTTTTTPITTLFSTNTTTISTVLTSTTTTATFTSTALTSTRTIPLSITLKAATDSSQWLVLRDNGTVSQVLSSHTGIVPQYLTLSNLNRTMIGYQCASIVNNYCTQFTFSLQEGWYLDTTYHLLYIHYEGESLITLTILP